MATGYYGIRGDQIVSGTPDQPGYGIGDGMGDDRVFETGAGTFSGIADGFAIVVPEPSSLAILCLAGFMGRAKRSR